ncbi:hypothetical protein [Halomonas caseinilytica]|uniref:hypothetical protein n=1 Tax=Halomonas caseinilytica TaxID=438744 RepID=UPI0010BE6EC0|nr:hypothetical protein [Halomonas caseinilytica]
MTNSNHIKENHAHEACEAEDPFHITKEEDRKLRQKAAKAIPSPVISHASFFDEYVQQLMIPPVVMDMARKW